MPRTRHAINVLCELAEEAYMLSRSFAVSAKSIVLAWALGILILGCPQSPSPPIIAKGSIVVSIQAKVSNARTLLPSIDMNPQSFTVSGTGPLGEYFSQNTAQGQISIPDLAAGLWSVTVNAVNADGAAIGTGTVLARVTHEQTVAVSVTVLPFPGTGSLSLAMTWPGASIAQPRILARLFPASGSPIDLAFVIDGASARCSVDSLPAGYYTLTLSLNDNTNNVAGTTDVVRIVQDQSTSGSYQLSVASSGGLEVVIGADSAQPFQVSITGGRASLTVGASMALNAVVSNPSGTLIYQWYVNGSPQGGNSPSLSAGGAFLVGIFRIDVVVLSAGGLRAGSASLVVSVTP